ncbi:MAG: hypothetical protein ABIT76_11730 [Chthoniobacterales bacterium]
MHLHRNITPNGVAKSLLAFIAFLVIADLIVVFLEYVDGYKTALGFVPLFDMDVEFNLPSLYSTFGILLCAFTLFHIGKIAAADRSSESRYWRAMGGVFVYLALDELISIHERLDGVVSHFLGHKIHHHEGPLWVLPYAVLLICFGLYFIRFYLRLPTETKIQFCLSGVIYVSGAVGVEILGNPFDNHPMAGFIKGLYSTLEETMEMVGMVMFLRALLIYLANHTRSASHTLTFHLQGKNTPPPRELDDLFETKAVRQPAERKTAGV